LIFQTEVQGNINPRFLMQPAYPRFTFLIAIFTNQYMAKA